MKINKLIKKFAIFATSAIFCLPTMQTAQAAPGTLSPAPLFLSNIVEPNVFLTYDNSGSMAWVPMISATLGFGFSSGRPVITNFDADTAAATTREVYNPDWDGNGSNRNTIPTEASYTGAWVLKNHNGNKSYYNPAISYVPWAGTDNAGNPLYPPASVTAARRHPHPGHAQYATTTNLLTNKTFRTANDVYLPSYYIWNDDGDNIIEPTDGKTLVTIASTDAEMQNFANWFVYYRTRELAAKAAIGQVIFNSDATRTGLALLHRRLAPTRIVVGAESMSDADKKRALLLRFYSERSANGTPLRNTLEDVGNYFMQPVSSGGPILDSGDGGECQQNFNILMTDGFWNGGNPSVGNADLDSTSDGDTIFDGHSAFPPTAAESNDGGNYADNFSNTLADVAMHYYENDLRPTTLGNKVPTQTGVDEADHQHLVNYTIAFGVEGTLDPLSTDPLLSDPLSKVDFWPQPTANSSTTIDDLWHAAYNSRGKFLDAQNPAQLETSLSQAISDIAERTATAAAVSINSSKLTQDAVVYLSEFNTNGWTGDIIAKKIIDLDTGALEPGERWKASEKLEARNFDTNPLGRVVLTHDGTDAVTFKWTKLTAAQKDDLRTNPAGGTDANAVAKNRLLYLRGQRVNAFPNPKPNFRVRNKRLGDIVNSGPVYVGKPDLNWPDTFPFPDTSPNRYTDFKNGAAASRMEMIYAGANDGMMHGFRASNGAEKLAYISGNLFSTAPGAGLHYLTDPDYIHRYYNDLTPTVSDIYADLNDGSGESWRTILIGGQRGGGRGIYALNVTDPTLFSNNATKAAQVGVWEFSNSDDADLGFTYSRPQIGMMNDGSWVAIIGNGYNDTGDGEAKLFILRIEEGVDGTWDITSGDYIKISTGVGTPGNRNGLATPALADLDGNGTIDRAYAGDLRGNMWSFDLSDTVASNWKIPNNKPLFTTIGGQPITAQPTLSKHPTEVDIPVPDSGANEPNVMVFFGSGQYLVNADKTTSVDEYFYGVWDRSDQELDASGPSNNLVEQTFQGGFNNIDTGSGVRVLSNNNVDYSVKYGWYIKLPDSGERSITKPVVRGNVVFFNTFVPEDDACKAGGYGYRMAVDLATGGPPKQTTIDVNGDGVIDSKDDATNGVTTETVSAIRQDGYLPEPVFIEDIAYTAETPSKVVKLKELATGRFSWQELLQ